MFIPGSDRPVRAALMMLGASALFAGSTILAKFLGKEGNGAQLHPFQVSSGRFLFALLTLSVAAIVLRPKIENPNWALHVGRTCFGWMGVTLMFAAVARIAVSDATSISFLNPVIGMILAIPILGEKVGPIRWLAAAIAFTGVLILLRPSPESFQPAALLALGAACVMGFEVTFIKLLSRKEAPLQILIINNLLGTLIACTAAWFVWQAPTSQQWMALGALGVVMVTAQSLFIQAMRQGDASYVLPFSYATLVFATLFDIWIFHSQPDITSIIGAAIIVFGALLLVWREAVNRKKKTSAEL